MAGGKKVDINDYFEYVEKIINETNNSDTEKKYYMNIISLYKVTGVASSDVKDILCGIPNRDPEEELYILFEILSMRYFKLLNYWAWRKRIKFGII
jgi:hypothetical protein